MPDRPNFVIRLLRGLWRSVTILRVATFNVLFLLLLVLVLGVLFSSSEPSVPERAALVLAPAGVLVEELAGDPVDRAVAELTGEAEPQTLVRDLIAVIEAATEDERITTIHLALDPFAGAGPSTLHRVSAALRNFRAAGKTIVASGSGYGNGAYLLAATADEILLHPMGAVLIDGYSSYRSYYRDGLDRLGVDVNVFRVGTYKSAVEPYLRDDMSPEAREANLEWMGDLWGGWLDEVAAARGLERAELLATIEGFAARVRATDGDLARVALDAGLVDRLAHPDEVRARLIELVGAAEDDEFDYAKVGFDDYLATLEPEEESESTVGILVASGTILDGHQAPGTIGGDSTAALVRQAREDESIKALVLRVDSPGGSAFASEVIRRELELTRAAGKVVVVSMGDVAASGGYWISTSSDAIVANPTTITGSIGIFGVIPTIQRPLAEYLGMRVDGVGTTPWSGAFRVDRQLDPVTVAPTIQATIEKGYRDFLDRVAANRGKTAAEIDPIAQGRVWSGADAHALGLVDRLGDLDEAVALAAEKAELGDDWSPRYVERELSFREQILADLFSTTARTLGPVAQRSPVLTQIDRATRSLRELLAAGPVQAHCMCGVDRR